MSGDGLHNSLGLAVASAFLVDIRLGITTCLVAAAHEVHQEMGDFGPVITLGAFLLGLGLLYALAVGMHG